MAPMIGLAAFIVNDFDDLILIKRGSKLGYGQFGLVGGKLEHGETPIEGISREVEEEIGLKIQPENFSTLNTFTNTVVDEQQYITLWFLARKPHDLESQIMEPHNILEITFINVCEFWQNRYKICRDSKYFEPLRDFCYSSECLKELRKKWLTLDNNMNDFEEYEKNLTN